MPGVEERLRDELDRQVARGDPAGVAERVASRATQLRRRRRTGRAGLFVGVIAGSVLAAALLVQAFGGPRGPAVDPAAGPGAATSPILFTGTDPGTGVYGIYLMNPNTGAVQLVPGTGSVGPAGPAWSPDGSEVAFAESEMQQPGIYLVDAGGGHPRHITSFGIEPAWSPDGSLIAFFWSPEGTVHDHIYVVRPDGTGLRELGPGAWPSWSPDGTRIAFATDRDRLKVMDADGSNVTDLGVEGIHPAWSPDGSAIVFSRDDGIYLMAPDGTDVRKITDGPPTYDDPVWSPDGKMIAFSYDPATTREPVASCPGGSVCEMAQNELWVMNADGTDARPLTDWTSATHGNGDTEPAWAPASVPLP